jgi:hypothetical protein
MLAKLKALMDNQTQLTHYVALIGTGLAAAYMGYSPFHDLVLGWYKAIPETAKVLIGTAGFLYAWYRNGQKPPAA